MGFGDLKSDAGIKSLNDFLCDKSYIEGFVPSQADHAVFVALASAPGSSYAHALRWYNQIKSYSSDEQNKFPGTKKDASEYGPCGKQKSKKDEDDFDLFGDDSDDEEETEEEKKIKEERLAAYAAKKAGKKKVIAKSSLLIDVKPWDDETDKCIEYLHSKENRLAHMLNMNAIEKNVRGITADGLLWGASKLVPLAYGIKKLQINAVIEDDKISTDWIEEEIVKFSDYVQSMDIAAFNKI